MLKKNSKKVLDIIAGQKTQNASLAYKQVYPNASDTTARNNASQLLKKPDAIIYLQEHTNKAIRTVVGLLDSDKPDIQLRASQDILDRHYGKAIQQVQTTSKQVVISIDLTESHDTLKEVV